MDRNRVNIPTEKKVTHKKWVVIMAEIKTFWDPTVCGANDSYSTVYAATEPTFCLECY